METPKLNLEGYGYVDAKIIWIEGLFYKISFNDDATGNVVREIFKHTEILNLNEVYIDSTLTIIKYDFY